MFDCHIHYANSLKEEKLIQIINEYSLDGIALMCIPTGNGRPTEKDAFDFKAVSPVPVYIFGGISRKIWKLSGKNMLSALDAEITRLMDMGCTGIKLLEGKPNVRKEYSIPDFDSPVWDVFWRRAEDENIPVVFHVNDPEEFWDAERVSEAAKKYGWFYDDSHVSNHEQYRQVFAVLDRHPQLRILFPHFFFLSKSLEKLSDMLDSYENVMLDVTPGIELFFNLSDNIQEAKAFFIKYQDRICYGTDIGARAVIPKEDTVLSIEESRARIDLITSFLETGGSYTFVPDGYYVKDGKAVTMNGLGLDTDILSKIYSGNFFRFMGYTADMRYP